MSANCHHAGISPSHSLQIGHWDSTSPCRFCGTLRFFTEDTFGMNKTEFVDAVAERADVQKSDAAKIVDALVEVVGEQLKKDEQITLVGFGTFLVSKREARKGRNPRTGEEIQIAASNVPRFKPGKALKETIN